jgi:quercetin dioxygenase-like cupin family protein
VNKKEKKQGFSCDWVPADCAGTAEGPRQNRSAIYRWREDYTWEGVAREDYKTQAGGWAAIARNVLIGGRGESARFDLRYFEIAPGGFSSLERHRHEHAVIGVRGRGQVLLGGQFHELGFLDTVYIAPGEPHQLRNPFADPFGFFCIVNHERDRPQPLDEKELQGLLAPPSGAEDQP